MPTIDIVRDSNVRISARARQLASMFELHPECTSERWTFDLTLPQSWSIGVIVGPSGSGKSTVAKEVFAASLVSEDGWPRDATIIDGFDGVPIKDVAAALSSVGFSSPPAWFRPFDVLSTGQKFRANVARALVTSGDTFVIDEYTSVVDRTVAQIGSAAVSKAVRAAGKRFVAVTCHYDVIEWLQPDWVLEMPDGVLTRRSVQRRPAIQIEVYRTTAEAWRMFSKHHYLSNELHKSSACYVALIGNRPVAFAAVMAFPHAVKPGWREHRTVVLPDFQGIGIGNMLSELIASVYSATGRPYYSTTTHPAMVKYRAKSAKWNMIRSPSRVGRNKTSKRWDESTSSRDRYTASFRYAGKPNTEAAKLLGIKVRDVE